MLTEEGVSLHAHEALNIWDNNLDDNIIVGFVRELAVVKLAEKRPSLAVVVALLPNNEHHHSTKQKLRNDLEDQRAKKGQTK